MADMSPVNRTPRRESNKPTTPAGKAKSSDAMTTPKKESSGKQEETTAERKLEDTRRKVMSWGRDGVMRSEASPTPTLLSPIRDGGPIRVSAEQLRGRTRDTMTVEESTARRVQSMTRVYIAFLINMVKYQSSVRLAIIAMGVPALYLLWGLFSKQITSIPTELEQTGTTSQVSVPVPSTYAFTTESTYTHIILLFLAIMMAANLAFLMSTWGFVSSTIEYVGWLHIMIGLSMLITLLLAYLMWKLATTSTLQSDFVLVKRSLENIDNTPTTTPDDYEWVNKRDTLLNNFILPDTTKPTQSSMNKSAGLAIGLLLLGLLLIFRWNTITLFELGISVLVYGVIYGVVSSLSNQ